MRSIFVLLSACGAVSHASECQAADETSLLQARSMARRHQSKAIEATVGAKAVLKSLQDVAESLTEGSGTTKSSDEVNDALEQANDLLATLSPAIREQVELAQQQIEHASSAVLACHSQAGINARAHLQGQVEQRAAALETCHDELAAAAAEEEEACARAEDCLCDEARVRHTDKVTLCAAMTETYEVTYCEHNLLCEEFNSCHSNEMEVYNALRGDAEAELEVIRQEYIAVEQSHCLTGLIMQAMTPPMTPISHAALIACGDVDVSALSINFPDLPAQPAACPGATMGHPQCGGLWAQHEVDRSKCNLNENLEYVGSQEECQALALANGHEFYSYRHNADDNGQHKCFSSDDCNGALIGDRTNEWNIYRAPDQVYMSTFQATGCPAPALTQWWRTVGTTRARNDMFAYCDLTRTGHAIQRQLDFCCGTGQQCTPANCVRQTTWA